MTTRARGGRSVGTIGPTDSIGFSGEALLSRSVRGDKTSWSLGTRAIVSARASVVKMK